MEIEGDQDVYLFCLSGVTIDDLELVGYDKNSITFAVPYNENTIARLKEEFGDHVVLIVGHVFRNRIGSIFSENQVRGIFDKVIYCQSNYFDRVKAFGDASTKRFLYKDIDLARHKEYRIAVDKNHISNNYFDIGSIKEITHICKIDDLEKYVLKFNNVI